jgi:site-specific recombinase XerD
MQKPNLPAIRALRPAWNKGRIVGQKLPLKLKHVWAIRVRLELAENHRELALFNIAIDRKLRGCDLVRMKVVDVLASGQIKQRASMLQSKTQKPVRFEISEGTRASVAKWMEDPLMIGSEWLWPGRFHERLYISTRQYARIVRDRVASIGLEVTAYGTHSMRRTKVTQIYKKTGNLRAVQLLLEHTKMDSTVRYLGVELEDALAIAEVIEI